MCGINGIFHFQHSAIVSGELERMNKALAHRGPDAEGVYRQGQIELGHRRLSIIDVSETANQPMTSQSGKLTIVYNGELYNYRELKSQLAHYTFKTSSDTEVILAAFEKWGHHALQAFNGIFSFAIWDNSTGELFIARDRLGVKPLYYFLNNDVFVFSSSLKSILATGRSAAKISRAGLMDYLRYQTAHAPATLIEDIQVLMPGHFATINEEDSLRAKPYWTITQSKNHIFSTYHEAKKSVRDQVEKSVHMQLVADVPFGAFLSGGIDSSLLVAIMAGQRNQKTDTFSVIFKEDQFSEKKFANLIAEKYQTNHHEIELSVADFRDMIPEALAFMDHPSGDGPNTFVVSKKTRDAGIKMALSGLGGDELFGGYSVFTQLPELHQKKWLRSFPGYARRPFAAMYANMKGTIAASKIAALLSLDEFDTEDIYQVYRQVFMDKQIIDFTQFEKLLPNRVHEIVKDQVGYATAGWHLSLLSKISVAEITTYMQNVLLRDADQMSMAHGLEVRVPFLDHDLVELALGISDQFKNPVTPKKILVDTFSDLLPHEIYNRPKMGFVLPYEIWMKNELKDFCADRINWLGAHAYFKEDGLQKIWHQFLKGDKRVSWSRVWILVVLSDWMKRNNVS